MAKLKITELNPAGSELFQDSENFLEELSDRELNLVVGGADVNSVVTQNSESVGSIQTATVVGISQTNVSVQISNVNASNVNASNVNVTA
jgi:soluble P-type ATPase